MRANQERGEACAQGEHGDEHDGLTANRREGRPGVVVTCNDHEVMAAAVTAMAARETCVRVSRLAAGMCWDHSRLSASSAAWNAAAWSRASRDLDGRGDAILLTETGRHAYQQATPPTSPPSTATSPPTPPTECPRGRLQGA